MSDKTVIKPIAAPAGASDKYQFFVNEETGREWKATVELKVARRPSVNDIDAAPTEMAATIVVSPVDDKGKALREDEKPVIIDSHTHTFTNVEMQRVDFDPADSLMRVIAERIHIGEARLSGVSKITSFVEDWNKKAKLKAGPVTFETGDSDGKQIPGNVVVVAETAVVTAPPAAPQGDDTDPAR